MAESLTTPSGMDQKYLILSFFVSLKFKCAEYVRDEKVLNNSPRGVWGLYSLDCVQTEGLILSSKPVTQEPTHLLTTELYSFLRIFILTHNTFTVIVKEFECIPVSTRRT